MSGSQIDYCFAYPRDWVLYTLKTAVGFSEGLGRWRPFITYKFSVSKPMLPALFRSWFLSNKAQGSQSTMGIRCGNIKLVAFILLPPAALFIWSNERWHFMLCCILKSDTYPSTSTWHVRLFRVSSWFPFIAKFELNSPQRPLYQAQHNLAKKYEIGWGTLAQHFVFYDYFSTA